MNALLRPSFRPASESPGGREGKGSFGPTRGLATVPARELTEGERAVPLVDQVRQLATSRGDQNEVIRVLWLEGRVAAGLSQPAEALALLGQARREFAYGKWTTT
jgi:hypothetical protein